MSQRTCTRSAEPRTRRRPGGVPWLVLLACLLASGCAGAQAETVREFRVCADPNNLPFSNQRGEGLENRLAELFAEELNAAVVYTWHAQRRGFFRETLRDGKCDVVMGVPTSFELAMPSRPYYRSTYVFVTRAADGHAIESMDDPLLRELRIGVHMIGDDQMNTPPAHALANRGIIRNVYGYMIYGDYREENPPARILDALAAGEIDVAIVWGPLAGYFAPRLPVETRIAPVMPQIDLPFLPFVYDMSLGVRRGDTTFVRELEAVMDRRRDDIQAILDEFGVPQVRRPGRRDPQ
jgi:mxaJ protein